MWRIAAVALLAALGCAGGQSGPRPAAAPNNDFVLQTTASFFAKENRGDDLLPTSTGDEPAGPAR
jgi:hypothetical protein